MHERYKELLNASSELGEHNDCAVITLAAIADISYNAAWELLDSLGREARGATPSRYTTQALLKLGLDISENIRYQFRAKTVRTLEREIKELGDTDRYLARVVRRDSAHIFAIVNGKAIDWASGGLSRVSEVYRIIPKTNLTFYYRELFFTVE